MSDGVIDVRTEMLLANQVDEASASHGFHGLLVGVAEDELHAIFLAVIVEILERIHARRVERRHAAHADDQVFRELLYRNVGNAVGHAEEHGAVDLVHAHTLGQLTQMRDLGIGVAIILPTFNLGFLGNHLHEQHHGNEHTHCDGRHQIKHNGKHEREQKRGDRALRSRVAQMREIAPTTHVVSDLQQNGRDGRHGDEGRVWHKEHKHHKQNERVHHTGDRRASAALHIGGRACDGARRGNAAEQHRSHIAYALSHELHIAAVVRADHGVSDDARQQRLDGGQNSDGDAVWQLIAQQFDRKLRHMQLG